MTVAGEVMVRMGEFVGSDGAGDVLVSIGLGSCIGLALVDAHAGVAGLAHIVLPQSASVSERRVGKFADLAVPALIERLHELGASRSRLAAVLVGGAQMFAFEGAPAGLEIGARNEAATRTLLEEASVPVRAAATGGSRGRTIRVRVGDGLVTVKEAGGQATALLEPPRRRAAVEAVG